MVLIILGVTVGEAGTDPAGLGATVAMISYLQVAAKRIFLAEN